MGTWYYYTSARRGLVCLILSGLLSPAAHAQNDQPAGRILLRGYQSIELGLPFPAVQERLREEPDFAYRGEPDLSLAPASEEQVIDTAGRGYLDRAVFQFQEDSLYLFMLYLDRRRLDYFQLYNRLEQRYGAPDDLDPQRAVWQDNATRIELERPLTVRFMDLGLFEQRKLERRALESIEETTRERFLDAF